MLSELKIKELQNFLTELSQEQINWASGYLAGRASVLNTPLETTASIETPKKISIVYATETGNSKKLATKFSSLLKASGFVNKVTSLEQYKVADLKKEEYFFVISSTHGEGEPPAAAKKFYDYIHSEKLELSNIKFSVLALGDSSYPLFCQTGKDFNDRLHGLQATAIFPLAEADVDFDEVANTWMENIVGVLKSTKNTTSASVVAKPIASSTKKFYNGKISTSINLNDRGSNKETYHLEIQVDEEVHYLPGDALALVPKNNIDLVNKIIDKISIDPNTEVTFNKNTGTLISLLTNVINVKYLSIKIVQEYSKIVEEKIPETRIDLLDLLHIYPLKNKEQFFEVLAILNPIAPRMYSISSSPIAHAGEIHITVSKNTYQIESGVGFGFCSEYISTLNEGDDLTFYISKNNQFRLPAHDQPIILIGPGTGIAPMRSFLAHRDATGATGENWLFFGEQHFASDFLYQTEIQNYIDTGLLTHFNAAFSRDQQEKIYVQHRILEQGEKVFSWIQKGATIFISGTKDPMSIDVSNAITQVISKYGNLSIEESKSYFDQMVEDGRYLADVY
jgi:sulfite reductase (NADPH) flavoprotein alpha-component